MERNKSNKSTVAFSLHDTAKPKFTSSQIRIDAASPKTNLGLSKYSQKLAVGRTGKIGFSK